MIEKSRLGRILDATGFILDDVGILNHGFGVGAFAHGLAKRLQGKGIPINPDDVHLASAVHDCGKMGGGPQGKEHVLRGYEILTRLGEYVLAEIMVAHEPYSFPPEEASLMELNTWERILIFLADLRFSGEMMSWNERINSLIKKYEENHLFPPGRKEWLTKTANQLIFQVREIIGPWDILEFTPFS